MAKFSIEETVAIAAINQLINDWVFELDFNHGVTMGNLITEDCSYRMLSGLVQGREAIVNTYRKRCDGLAGRPDGVPPMRHLNANLRVNFITPVEAAITFGLLFFTAEGHPAGSRHTDAAAVADVWMTVRCEDDGHWRISHFESVQPFHRGSP